jgi:hypothetical protein
MPLMTSQFDASFAYTGPISAEIEAAQAREIGHLRAMPGKLANAALHANNELNRWVIACNRLVWGGMPADARRPAPGEIAALLGQLPPENRERLLRESQLAAEARNLVALLAEAETEAALREEFEAFDLAGKEARFQAWRSGGAI